MTSIQSIAHSSPSETRAALCLCGGGITGAMYEVGCLAAIEDAIPEFRASDFDVYIGASSGATVASVLAGGYPAQRLYRALLDPADDFFPFHRNKLLRPGVGEWKRVSGSLLEAGRRIVMRAAVNPREFDIWSDLDRLYDSLPAGFFTLGAYETFLEKFFERRGIPNRFDAFQRKLFLIGYNLDTGRRCVFGAGEFAETPVSKAICASSATPVLFEPVRWNDQDFIDGGLGDVGHADIAIGQECGLIVAINPSVPVYSRRDESDIPTGHGPRMHVRDKGLLWVYNQAMRMRTGARLSSALKRLENDHPGTRIMLIEPDRGGSTMFMYSPMNFEKRRAILREAYARTTTLLAEEKSSLHSMIQLLEQRKRR